MANANAIKAEAEEKFLAAKPKLEAAEKALENLDEKSISVFKGFKSPPALCVLTGKVVLFIFKSEKVDLFGEKDNESGWKKTLVMLGNVKKFVADLKKFSFEDAKTLDQRIVNEMNKLINSGKFNVPDIFSSSQAAGNLGDWAHNIIAFNQAFTIVAPLEEKKNLAEAEVAEKTAELNIVKERVRVINEKLAGLKCQLDEAIENKRVVEEEKDRYQTKLVAAGKLVNGLAGENKRWTQMVKDLSVQTIDIIGDV